MPAREEPGTAAGQQHCQTQGRAGESQDKLVPTDPSELFSTLNHDHLMAAASLLSPQIPASAKPGTTQGRGFQAVLHYSRSAWSPPPQTLCRGVVRNAFSTASMAEPSGRCQGAPWAQGLCVTFVFLIPVLSSEEDVGRVGCSYNFILPALVVLQKGELMTSPGSGSSAHAYLLLPVPQLSHSSVRGVTSWPFHGHSKVTLTGSTVLVIRNPEIDVSCSLLRHLREQQSSGRRVIKSRKGHY